MDRQNNFRESFCRAAHDVNYDVNFSHCRWREPWIALLTFTGKKDWLPKVLSALPTSWIFHQLPLQGRKDWLRKFLPFMFLLVQCMLLLVITVPIVAHSLAGMETCCGKFGAIHFVRICASHMQFCNCCNFMPRHSAGVCPTFLHFNTVHSRLTVKICITLPKYSNVS